MDTNNKDRLRILFIEPWFFMDKEDKVTLRDDTIFYTDIEKQLTKEQLV